LKTIRFEMSASPDSVTEKTLVTNETSENETESHNKENRVINETTVTPKRELDVYLETLKGLVREFQTECTGDQDLFKLVEDQEETLKNTTKVENRAAVLLQGARGSKDEVLRQGLKVIGDGDWQKFFHENKLGTTKNYGGLEIRRLETLTEWDDELSTLADQFLSIWESNTSLLPCSYARMLLNLRKKRIILEKRITTCVSIIRRLSKPPQKTSQMASFKLDELKIKLKKLELDWKRHQENEIEMLEQYRENRRKQKEKEEQRLKKELEKQERNAEKERQKLERRYRIQQREDKKRILQEQRERKKMETEAEQQSIHRQAAVLENFIKSVPKLSLFHGVNRRSVSISDELQQMTRENMKQEEINDIVQNLLVSIKHIRKKAWNSLGIKYVSFGQCYGNRVKLIQFEDSLRPPFHGVVPQKPSSTLPNGRNPFIRLGWLDYDYDSEIEWVESEPGESISESASEDDDSLMDIECNSSSDTDSFLIDDEHTSQSIHESGLEGCFPLQEELVGIVFCHEANEAQREILSKFPRKPISNIKIVNDNNVGTSLKTSLDSHDNSENLSNDQAEQVLEMTENWRTLEDFWNVQEKYKEEGFQVPSSATGT
jgi:hypothetical protein